MEHIQPEEQLAEDDNEDLLTLKAIYFHSVVVAPQSIPQFKFYEDVSIHSGTDRYILLSKDKEPAIFQVTGVLTHLSITSAGAVQHRRHGSKVDEYTARLRIDDEKHLQIVENGLKALINLLKETTKACENIAVSSGLVENRKSFKLDEITVKISNYGNDVFYFNRKVATKDNVPIDDGNTPDFLLNIPQQGADYPILHYPTGWNLNPLIPVTDVEALTLRPEDITLPRRATVYFEMRQGCYNFEGTEGPIRQIVLIPSIISIKVYPPSSEDHTVRKAKRRRVSCI